MDAKPGLLCLCCCFALLLLGFQLQQQQVAAELLGAPYVNCLRNSTSLSSTFTRNLNTALRNLTNLSSQGTENATTTVGSLGQDMVYAAFQCRGDMSLNLCWECMQNATVRLPQHECPNAVEARIQLDGCFLRYGNKSFFVLDTTFVQGYCSGKTSDAAVLSTIQTLVDNVTSQAPKQGGFASDSANAEYAAAQCLGYLTQSECAKCLSAVPYRTVCDSTLGQQVHLASCYYRYEAYAFLEAVSPAPSPTSAERLAPVSVSGGGARLVPPPGDSAQPHGSKVLITTIAVVGVIVVVGALCAILLLMWRHKKASKKKGVTLANEADNWQPLNKAQVYTLQELQEATANFHAANKLGEGGFGIVYKGTLGGGKRVAIKKLSIGSQQGKQEFLNEVNLITSVQHKNLIRLLGCCVEGPERILVYEYLPNKSLDRFIYGEARERTLNWSTRYGIIIGIAKGLTYLHEESYIRIIHRDIKPSNILLDDQLNPVIADFGIAKFINDNVTHVNTRVAGTMGYLAPEYALRGALSEKVDVFSFGVVSLEVVTGKKNGHSALLTWVWEMYRQEKVLNLVDEKLGNSFSPIQVIRVVHVALLCTQEDPKLRPTMSVVTQWLSGISNILEIPTRPTFLDSNDYQCPSTSSTSSQSANGFGGQASQGPV